jgi:hypothetical protein
MNHIIVCFCDVLMMYPPYRQPAADVQFTGCAAASNVCSGNPRNKAVANAMGVLEAVATALAGHPASPKVQEFGVVAVRNLSLDAGNRAAMTGG